MNPHTEKHTTVMGLGTVPVNSLPIGQKVDKIVSLGEVMSAFCTCFNMLGITFSPLPIDIWKVKLHMILRSAIFLAI